MPIFQQSKYQINQMQDCKKVLLKYSHRFVEDFNSLRGTIEELQLNDISKEVRSKLSQIIDDKAQKFNLYEEDEPNEEEKE
jgi:hypothetical protein